MELIYFLVGLPFAGGLFCLLFPKIKEITSLSVSVVVFAASVFIFLNPDVFTVVSDYVLLDYFSRFILASVTFFGMAIIVYSVSFMKYLRDEAALGQYYCYMLWSLGACSVIALTNNLVLLLVSWGFIGLALYMLIQVGRNENNSSAAKKSLIMIGGTDSIMIIGIAIIWVISGTFSIDKIRITMTAGNVALASTAFFCLLAGILAKAGAVPVHTWIPEMAEESPVPVSAFFPASIDKLIGIYLLVRISVNIFDFSAFQSINLIVMSIGAVTIIIGVFMAMVQHDMKKLLSYHAVSQVGYMILGIGTGTAIGIVGGIFHMLNNAIYKSCFFLCSGSVEEKTGTTELDRLGGLSRYMPQTFLSFLVASLSISGIPPFNGFFSKWLIYQGIVEKMHGFGFYSRVICIACIISAMFGSALTLASFMKLVQSVFLGQAPVYSNEKKPREAGWPMWSVQLVLASLCILFGVFAFQVPLKLFILPSLNLPDSQFTAGIIGLWQPGLTALLIVIGILLGFAVYFLAKLNYRNAATYIGGEELPEEARVTGVDSYLTIRDMGFFKFVYYLAERKLFDIYYLGKSAVLMVSSVLSVMHTGNLHVYLSWSLLGIVVLLLYLVR